MTYNNKRKNKSSNNQSLPSLAERSGPLSFTLLNDILFKLLMQENQDVLRAFLCALLRLKPSQITSINIRNAYILGKTIDSKSFSLDINLILNETQIINLELQVLNKKNWSERSLVYLCRNFDNANRGDDYAQILSAHHIGILDFILPSFKDEFYSHFYLMNSKTHKIYSDKFTLSVLNLNQSDKATQEDIDYKLPYWSQLFKATTWEELKKLAEKNSIFESATNTVNELLLDDAVRQDCLRREEELAYARHQKNLIDKQQEELLQKEEQLLQKDKLLSQKDEQLSQQSEQLSQQSEQLSQMSSEIARLKAELAKRN